MNTFQLAQQLGAVETFKVTSKLTNKQTQPFDYLFVLDFETTCWEPTDKCRAAPEIIEFSVVLYDVRSNVIETEYQQYVMPTEIPKLSQFCKTFTGIAQEQVDDGVPLKTCLMLFSKWVKELSMKYNLSFPVSSSTKAIAKKTVFSTWSDWDLNICLQNECKRKCINKPDIFNMWIDVRALYKEHYSRRPKGLNGALKEVGLEFIGREHSGLHDARNTAYLIGTMIENGVLLQITKDISIKC